MKSKHPVGFLNVDLEIVSKSKLDAITANLCDRAHAIYSGSAGKKGIYLLALECNKYPKDPDAGILAFCSAVEGLGKEERRLWDGALSRTFDVGFQLESGIALVQATIRPETLARVIAVRGTVAFSCYSFPVADKS